MSLINRLMKRYNRINKQDVIYEQMIPELNKKRDIYAKRARRSHFAKTSRKHMEKVMISTVVRKKEKAEKKQLDESLKYFVE